MTFYGFSVNLTVPVYMADHTKVFVRGHIVNVDGIVRYNNSLAHVAGALELLDKNFVPTLEEARVAIQLQEIFFAL
jgi:hypothetical protein